MAQVGCLATVHEQDVGLPNPGNPALLTDSRQGGELEEAQRLPTEAAHGVPRRVADNEAAHRNWSTHRVAPLRRRNAERVGLGESEQSGVGLN